MIRIAPYWLSLLLALLAPGLAAGDAPMASWEFSPYRIQLLVAVEPAGALVPRLAQELPAELAARSAAAAGGLWRVQADSASAGLQLLLLPQIESITAKDLPTSALAGDKVLLVAIRQQNGLRVQAREMDVATGLWNSVITRDVPQPERLTAATVEALFAAFAPLGRIESVEGGSATLKLRGARLTRSSRAAGQVTAGTVFRPVLMASDSRGNLQAKTAQPIDWTFLVATSVTGSEATCRIETGLSGDALPAYHPQRPRWALAVAPGTGQTQLRLVAADQESAPLEGCDVLAASSESGAASEQRIGTSDANGVVSVPAGSSAMRLLLVRRGQQTLARVPLVPGLAAEISLALPDDRQRVELESALDQVEDALVDLAARREGLAARAKLAIAAGDDAAAERLKQQLGATSGDQTLTARLSQVAEAVKNSQPPTQAALQPRVEALRKAMETLAAEKPQDRLGEPKKDNSQPAAANSTESKPTESKPTGAKPVEAKSAPTSTAAPNTGPKTG